MDSDCLFLVGVAPRNVLERLLVDLIQNRAMLFLSAYKLTPGSGAICSFNDHPAMRSRIKTSLAKPQIAAAG